MSAVSSRVRRFGPAVVVLQALPSLAEGRLKEDGFIFLKIGKVATHPVQGEFADSVGMTERLGCHSGIQTMDLV